ncbi:MAG: hypothetical protein JWM11_3471 [Planctomycetaceae bacterium]|nr:hypothetical protein [Planctomycetaceae bacterium]
MRLRVDTRLPHDLVDVSATDPPEIQRNRAVYRITEVVSETPWCGLYRAKKVFRNFDFKDRRIVEVDQDECLDVFVKTLLYPTLDQRNYVTARRELAAFEARKVMGCRETNLIPEPLGFLEVRNDEDAFTFPRAGQISGKEPILICEAIHGESLARWRQQRQPELLQILRVLSELLELIGTFHEQHMLINNVSPATFWIDSTHRVHFIGTENVVDQSTAAAMRFLFPPQRYARGFAAPELGHHDTPPSTETDLYGWAAVAYFLITGDSPARLAADQQQTWARFESPQRQLLLDALWSLTDSQIRDVQQWLGVTGTRFATRWPEGFVDGLLTCLDPDPALRPPDVVAVRNWWTKAPPPRVPVALAVFRENGHVHLQFSTDGLPSALTFHVRRKLGTAPRAVTDGIEVWKGTKASRIEDVPPRTSGPQKGKRSEEWHYSVFSQDNSEQSTASSLPCPVLVLDGTRRDYRRHLAEQFAAKLLSEVADTPSAGADAGSVRQVLTELELLAELETLPSLAMELLGSREAIVRSWAILLLDAQLQRVPADQACVNVLLEHGLNDAAYQLRRETAAVLVKCVVECDVNFVVQVLAPALGGTNLDDRVRAVRGMTAIGLSRSLIDQAIRTFELDRPVECSVCQLHFRAGDIDEHLIQSHGFVPLEGEVLPLGEALKRLWAGIFQRTEPFAFQELVRHFSQRHVERTADALWATFRQRFLQQQEDPQQRRTRSQLAEYLAQLVRCLAADPRGEELCCQLLVDEDPVLNQLGRQFFIRRAAQELAPDDTTVATFRQWLDFLAPHNQGSERIQISEQLVALGANPTVAQTIRQELELSRFILCPECGESLQVRTLGRHRRIKHQVFEFENQRFSLIALVGELASRLISLESNLFTAMTLMELHEEQFREEALAKLCELLFNKIRLLDEPDSRNQILVCAASSLAPLGAANRLCHQLFKSEPADLIELGLLLFGHLTKCPDVELARRASVLVGSGEVSRVSKSQATVALVRWSDAWPDVCRKGLIAYATGISDDPLERSEALQSLQDRTGESPLIQEVCQTQAENRRIRCPKCEQILTGREMAEHALTEHQRIFDGRSLRRPWSVAVEALETYANQPDPKLLSRGEKLAQVEYPHDGLVRFVREALKRGIDPGNYRQTLEQSDPKNHSSICPTCFEPVARPLAAMTSVECPSENELQSHYVSIIRHTDFWVWISSQINGIQSEWSGPQPGWALSVPGLVCLILAVTWSPALGLLLLFGLSNSGPLTFAATSWGLGTVMAALAAVLYRPRDGHVLDTAWGVVVPQLIKTGITDEARPFIAGLCIASVGRGNRNLRRAPLEALLEHFDRLAARGIISEACFGGIARLQLHDALDRGSASFEIIDILTKLLRGCLSGERPLSILNLATTNGTFFSMLPAETVVAIRWRFLQIAQTLEWSFPDLFVAAQHCAALRAFICPSVGSLREILADDWALLELNAEILKRGYLTAPDLIDKGILRPFQPDVDLLCQTSDLKIRVYSRGLIIDRVCHAIMPTVSSRSLTKFVQTGWAHEKQNGLPDQRFKNNAPKGYYKKKGYEFRLNTKTTIWKTDPTAFVNHIKALSSLLFGQIKLRAEELERQKTTFHVEQIFRPRIATCLNCGQLLIHGEGRFADAVKS